ncbi:phage antirepressor [Lactobacillus delbrueckii subsp. bulgaricus]
MDNKVQVFNFEEQSIRTMLIDGKPFFVGKDVAKTLGYKKPLNALATHVDEDDSLKQGLTDSLGRVQETIVINESGLYALIMASQLPEAKKFKHWVTSEVLPAIRKHGAYMTDQKIEEILSDPDTIIKLATDLKAEREGRLIAEQRVNELTPKASYYDLVLKNESLVTITQIAKDYGMSGREMNAKLHELKVQYKQGSTWLLYSKYQKTGWTHSDTIVVDRADGTKKAVMQTKWTQKGRLGLYELLKSNGVLPLIEQEEFDF